MKNIFIEGIQGMGKSTLTRLLAEKYPEYRVCHEGDYNPVELAWCTWMNEEEYGAALERYPSLREEIQANTTIEYLAVGKQNPRYVVTYTRILTDIPGFHKDLERFEIYNGRKSLEEIKEIVLSRYEKFAGQGYIFECSFLQNLVEDLILFHQLSDEEILDFYRQLYAKVDKDSFMLLYLYSDKVDEYIRAIRKERCDEQGNQLWYQLMLGYFTESPYGRAHGAKDFEDLIRHFRHRQQVELRIIREIVGENAMILQAKEFDIESISL